MNAPGHKVDLLPAGETVFRERLLTLLKTPQVELLQLCIPKGSRLPVHQAVGEIIFLCLRGRIALSAPGAKHALSEGQLIYLKAETPVSIEGLEDAVLVVSIVAPKEGPNVELIGEHVS
jgi:quercetin dioxygenase-like cupin family protein